MKKPSRNEACWCGSGQKYKTCHLESDLERDRILSECRKQGFPVPSLALIKTHEEIEGIRKACQLTCSILDQLNDIIKPGMTTDAINTWVHDITLQNGAVPAPLNYRGFPKSVCTSLNQVICHGIPDTTIIREGDILNVDVTCILNGYYGDSNRMYTIGKVSPIAQKLVDVALESLMLGIAAVKPYSPLSTIGLAIEQYAVQQGFSVVRDYGGHGIGRKFHEDPFIFHYARASREMILVPNMVFTIEPMINQGTWQLRVLDDGWTAVTRDNLLSAQWEHTVRVTDTGAEILTN